MPSESYVKLLIKSTNLEKEKKEFVERFLTQQVDAYAKLNLSPRDNLEESLNSFVAHLCEVYEVLVVNVCKGSVIIILDCPALSSLELLWSDYRSGHLDKVAERYLVSDDIKKKLKLETICLKASIEKENYLNCMRALMKLPNTSLGEYKKSV